MTSSPSSTEKAEQMKEEVEARCRELERQNESLRRRVVELEEAQRVQTESERRYRALTENFPQGAVYIIDKELRFVLVDGRGLGQVGLQREKLVGNTVHQCLSPKTATIIEEHSRRVFEKGGESVFETEYAGRRYENFAIPIRAKEGEIHQMLVIAQDMTERWEFERALRAEEKEKSIFLDSMTEMAVFFDRDLRIRWANKAAGASAGVDPKELRGRFCYQIWDDLSSPCEGCPVIKAWDDGCEHEIQRRASDGRVWSLRARPAFDETGDVIGVTEFGWEITEQQHTLEEKEHLEKQLLQAQKLEAVGRLAGGVTHDFNNMLTLVYGNIELAEMMLEAGHPVLSLLAELRDTAERSAALTRQLLAFSRKQQMIPRSVDLDLIVSGLEKLLCRLIGEDIELIVSTTEESLSVMADPGQLEQVVFNLAVNARDAMPEGGKLQLATSLVHLGEDDCRRLPELSPGSYARLRVSDTGHGMDAETQLRVFEPFFTTKSSERGTGLGLSTVYGIVKQHGGAVELESAPGQGTSFDIYLSIEPEVGTDERHERRSSIPPGAATVLVVEDDSQVRKTAVTTLERLGYRVFHAENGRQALAVVDALATPLDVLLTDVVMPEMNGRELAETLTERHPDIRVLFTSGYTDDIVSRQSIEESGGVFLEKPYTPRELARKLGETLKSR